MILNGRGRIGVGPNPVVPSPTLNQVTITITYPGRSTGVTLVTNISRL